MNQHIMRVMSLTKAVKGSFGAGRMTPVTIAGERKNIKSLKALMTFFKQNYGFIIDIFKGDQGYEPIKYKVGMDKKITLKVFSEKELDQTYLHFAELFYWATFVNDTEMINLFLVGLGFSPLMNSFKG